MSRFACLLALLLLPACLGCFDLASQVPDSILQAEPLPLPMKPQDQRPAPAADKTYLVHAKGMAVQPRTADVDAPRQPADAATRAIARLGSPAVGTLVRQLHSGDPQQQMQAAEAVSWMGPEGVDAAESLVVLLENPATPAEVQTACIDALAQIGPAIWPEQPTPPSTASYDAAAPTNDPRRQAEQQAYQQAVAEYHRRQAIAQRAVNVLARLMRQS